VRRLNRGIKIFLPSDHPYQLSHAESISVGRENPQRMGKRLILQARVEYFVLNWIEIVRPILVKEYLS
jgi:hypothetical protein